MTTPEFDHLFRLKLDSWTPLTAAYHEVFTDTEVETLRETHARYESARRTVVLLSFENRMVSLGGLGTVMRHFPAHLACEEASVVLITPLHRNHHSVKMALESGALVPAGENPSGRCGGFLFDGCCYRENDAPVPTYHVGIDGYFTAAEDPYHYERQERLLEDVLAFSFAVPRVAAALGIGDNVLYHANDWETALVGLSAKVAAVEGWGGSSRTVLTLHNSFDHGLPPAPAHRYLGRPLPRETVLQCALPFVDGPVSTVSAPFARELRHDPLQTSVFVPHLSEALRRNPPVGVENGPFGTPTPVYAPAALHAAARGDMRGLVHRKREYERLLRRRLREHTDHRSIGRLAFDSRLGRRPVFVMSGRFDLAQKGFDVLFHAFRRLPPATAYLLFSPSNPDSGNRAAFRFFLDCATERDGEITILPYRIPSALYQDVLRGASYLLMPSLYEPFGAATEGALNGTPVVARGTGGLWRQVRSWTPCTIPAFYGGVIGGAAESCSAPTGILHREEFPDEEAGRQWPRILALEPRERMTVPLYRSMVETAHKALLDAVDLYRRPSEYAAIIRNGLEAVADGQTGWAVTVEKYRGIYDVAGRA